MKHRGMLVRFQPGAPISAGGVKVARQDVALTVEVRILTGTPCSGRLMGKAAELKPQ